LETPSRFVDLRSDLFSGKISCYDLVSHYLTNIRAQEDLNAWVGVYGEEALLRAREIDSKIKKGTAGRLAGMVVGIKDVLSYAGHPLQAGSNILKGFHAAFTGTAVQRLIDADAIIIGRQNCDEFAMGSSNENSAFGPVRNPVDKTRVPGGSSGGSAVAVAANMCRVSLGSDTGGSVRQPAAFCGVFGLKPTYSRISRYGLVAYGSSFDCIGVFAKDAEDIALVLEVIAGVDDYDSTVSRKPVEPYVELTSKKEPYTIAYIRETVESTVLQPEIRTAMQKSIDDLQAKGHRVTAIDFPLLRYLLPTYYILATAEASSNLSRYDGVRYGHRSAATHDLASMYKKSRVEGFGKEVQRRILLGTFVLSANYYDAYYTKAQKVRRLIRDHTRRVLSEHDFILMPTTPTTAFRLGEHTANPLEMYLADIYSVQANVAGVPAISFPYGKDKAGLPIGLQALANDFKEGKLLALAREMASING
jgi:aspartyl-tRNA(Asn)/glutamyl-tRNA(Gln) amidotransferase subunit A